MSAPAARPPTKAVVRSAILAARRRRPPAEQRRAAEQLCERVLALPEVAAAPLLAAYRSLPGEPSTAPLISALQARGTALLLPVLQADRSLRWGLDQPARQHASRVGSTEPAAGDNDARLLCRASVIICPGVAGDREGNRLGRGGGSYDRALAGIEAGVLRCLLLYDDEVLAAVPTQPHDQTVDVLVTPTRTLQVVRRV